MTLRPVALLVGLAVLPLPGAGQATARPNEPAVLLAQATDGAAPPSSSVPDADAGVTGIGPGGVFPAPTPTPSAGNTPLPSGTAPAASTPPAASAAPGTNAASTPPTRGAAPTGVTRNGAAALPTRAQPGPATPNPGASSITFGGPKVDVQPIYGSPVRDNGSGNGGIPVYNSMPGTPGGPTDGTANSYYETLPNGAPVPGQPTTAGRGTPAPNGATSFTRQPLGGTPYTRDQTGTYGGRAGYNAQGVYNGTAAQTGNGFGYRSPYAPSGRPTGGLLSTGVDATGPLRPYIPLNNGTVGRPNSGYGVPNGSRPTHMDARGIQRLN